MYIIYIRICICLDMYIYIYICIHIHYVYTYIYTYTYMHIYISTYSIMHIICTYIYIYLRIGTLTDTEREELTREFSSYDKNGDKKIDEAELRAVIQDPHAHDMQQMMESLMGEMEDGKISKEQWTEKFETFSVSMLTDNGELLRFPEEYEGIQLPFKGISLGPGEEEELQHDEL